MEVVREDSQVVRAILEDFWVLVDLKSILNCLKRKMIRFAFDRRVNILLFFHLDEFVRELRMSMFDDSTMVLMVDYSFAMFVRNVCEIMNNFEYVRHC